MDKADFYPYLLLWVLALGIILRQSWRQASSGLILAYGFQMWMLHWLGAALHALPSSALPDSEIVWLGFRESTYGILAFAAGAAILGPVFAKRARKDPRPLSPEDARLPWAYIWVGLIAYAALAPTIGRIPGLAAVVAVSSQLVIVGCCLRCWVAWRTRGNAGLLRILLPTAVIPLVTVVTQGFLGYGVIAVSIILLFTAQFYRPRWILIMASVLAVYLGMSVYISYMRDRNDIRAVVWGGEGITERVSHVMATATNMDWFNPGNQDHLELVESRLNQNVIVGAAVVNLSQTGDFARGATITDAFLAVIPRLIWPDKPMMAGSHGLVTGFTGMTFAEGTSVGVGQVLEFYGNFGTIGVFVGFVILGSVLRALDLGAGAALAAGDWQSFTTFFLIGISFLNVGGSLVEITAGAMASLVVANGVRHLVKSRFRKNPPVPTATVQELPLAERARLGVN